MISKHCPACRTEIPEDSVRCPVCAAALSPSSSAESPPIMPEDLPTTSASSQDLSNIGYGALGNVEVKNDASRHTTNNSSSTSQAHHEDKSQHSHVHYHGVPPANPPGQPVEPSAAQFGGHGGDRAGSANGTMAAVPHSSHLLLWTFGLVCVVLATIVLIITATRPADAGKAGVGSSITSQQEDHRPEQIKSLAASQQSEPANASVPATAAPNITVPATIRPIIEFAEIGIVSQGSFMTRTTFKSGDLLTLRLRVSRDCHLRVLYQPAQGAPMRMFPESDDASDRITAGSMLLIPDPGRLAAKTADATAFQLYHDTGSGPPIQEQILVQIAEEPFTGEGAIRVADAPYRTYQGLTLADARMRGVLRLQGLSANAAQARMDALLSERTLPFTITP